MRKQQIINQSMVSGVVSYENLAEWRLLEKSSLPHLYKMVPDKVRSDFIEGVIEKTKYNMEKWICDIARLKNEGHHPCSIMWYSVSSINILFSPNLFIFYRYSKSVTFKIKMVAGWLKLPSLGLNEVSYHTDDNESRHHVITLRLQHHILDTGHYLHLITPCLYLTLIFSPSLRMIRVFSFFFKF